MPSILITGFEPFNGAHSNPSAEVAQALSQMDWPEQIRVHAALLAVERFRCLEQLQQAIRQHQPDLVIALGLAASRPLISVERVALNIDDFPIPDNQGTVVIDQAIVEDGPFALPTRLPVKAILKALQQQGFPCELSYSAGTYVCNHLFYGMQHDLRHSHIRSGFVHLPSLDDQDGGLSLARQCQALVTLIHTCLTTSTDIAWQMGKID